MKPAASIAVSTQAALLALVAIALLAGVVPAGVLLERWLARELEARVRADLAMAPRLLAERNASVGDAMMMHAKDIAHEPVLAEALGRGDGDAAARAAEQAARALSYRAILVDARGRLLEGSMPPAHLLEATRRGQMPVAVVADRTELFMISLAPVEGTAAWLGAAGVATPLDESAAAALAGLTRSDRVLFVRAGRALAASAGDSLVVPALARAAAIAASPAAGSGAAPAGASGKAAGTAAAQTPAVRALRVRGHRFLFSTASLGEGSVVFVRDLDIALAMLPRLRWMLAASGAAALLLALLLGSLLASLIGRPVRSLAAAADRLSRGDFGAPLGDSRIRELGRVTRSFDEMRRALAVRIDELRAANRALEERQARLTALQAELIRRERAAISSRMVAELAHEIRNPIANVRNCLEVIYRRLRRADTREFAALAIDELLRMHELAERMLDLNRPRAAGASQCDAAAVASEVAALARVGLEPAGGDVAVRGGRVLAGMPPDALKQVLLGLVQNAREAVPSGLRLEIVVEQGPAGSVVEVADNGPGIPEHLRERVFEPFFTTRSTEGGVGLGLSVVEATLRRYGASIAVRQAAGGGACFRILLPPADEAAATAGVVLPAERSA